MKIQVINEGPGFPYFEIGAVCALDQSDADEAAEEFGVPGYTDYDQMLANDELEAIFIYSGPNGRADLIKKAIRAGKHVVTTKPFELDAKAAKEVLEEAEELGKVVHLNSPGPVFTDDMVLMNQWKEEFNLGRPIAARHECWYKSLEKADGSWYDDPVKCPVAPIFRLGIYGINDLVSLFGEPEEVQVVESRIFTGRPTPDLAQLTIKFQSGSIAHTQTSWALQPQRGAESMMIYFENGMIVRNPLQTDNGFEQELVDLHVIGADSTEPLATAQVRQDRIAGSYQWENSYKAMKGEKLDNLIPRHVVLDGIRVINAMSKASESKKTERLESLTD